MSNSRQQTDNAFVTLNPQYPTTATLSLTQPLWRGILLALTASVLVLDVVLQGVFPIPGVFYHLAVFTIGVYEWALATAES